MNLFVRLARTVSIILLSLFVASCANKSHHDATASFYLWRTTLKLSDCERRHLDSLSVKKLYVRCFDVDVNADGTTPEPVATVRVEDSLLNYEIIPVVYLTNKVFLNIPSGEIPKLAKNVLQLINSIPLGSPYSELQFDCDWSERTRDKYFEFLNAVRSISDPAMKLSATIRLHQVKYRNLTGVPPVDRGMLMFYNVDRATDEGTVNSILNLKTITDYTDNISDYPLPLDVALPIYSQGILFRDEKAKALLEGVTRDDFSDESKFSALSGNRFRAKQSFYLGSNYIYEGDIVRLESVSNADLKSVSRIISEKVKNTEATICFFRLDDKFIKRTNSHEIQDILACYR